MESYTCNKCHGNRGREFQFSDVAIEIKYRNLSRGAIRHIAIDSTGLKVFGEWKVKKYGSEKRQTWRKLHPAVDVDSHEIISAEMTLINVGDS